MEDIHSGLGFAPIIVDPRLAPRGEQFTNVFQEDQFRKARDGWDDFREPGDAEEETVPVIDMNTGTWRVASMHAPCTKGHVNPPSCTIALHTQPQVTAASPCRDT